MRWVYRLIGGVVCLTVMGLAGCGESTPVPKCAGKDCNDQIDCTTDACDEVSGECVNIPDDGACAAGEVCNADTGCVAAPCEQDADCDDGLYCNGAETCVNGACTAGAFPCDDSVACTTDSCDDDADSCGNTPDNNQCNPGEVCDPVAGCQAQIECTSDQDCDDGLFCNGAETCQNDVCAAGTVVSCDDSVACTVDSCDEDADACQSVPDHGACQAAEVCDPAQGCIAAPCNVDADCDDGHFCNGTETCSAGTCAAGTAVLCDDSIDCTEDACNEVSDQCEYVPNDGRCGQREMCDPAQGGCVTAPCTADSDCADGVYCNGAETCQAPDCVAGAAVDCDDSVVCTLDSCDENNDVCDNLADHGQCPAGEICDVLQGCVGVPCTVDSDCDDGLYCNGAETCPGQNCASGTPPDCADTVTCTLDSCDETNDLCLNTPDDAACDDGLYCTGAETCDALLGCQAGTAVDCVDASECTQDSCDEVNNQCDNMPLPFGTPCAGLDGDYCTSTCNFAGGCNNFIPVDCSDGLECTGEACDPTDGSCSNPPLAAGIPCFGTDNDQCTSSCDGSGACDDSTAPSCDDGLFCNGAESCVAALGCVAGSDPCDDDVGCTEDGCDEGSSTCTNTADDGLCDDGLYCTGVETCDPVSGCLAGTPVECTGSGACLMSVCSELLQGCADVPEDLDGDGHQPVACGGDDCDDTNPNSYPGATEICDGDDNDCDTEIDEGFAAYRDPCLTDADCCSNNCVNDICDFPAGACLPEFSVCTADGDCCSNSCGPDIAGVLRCQSEAICLSEGSPCTRATDCCSMYCVAGACATGGLCVPDGGVCTVNEDCCGSFCDAGNCDADAGSCFPLGETCSSPGNCCSNVCIEIQPGESRCNYHSECYDEGEHCLDDSDCCNCLCESDGFCGSPGACSTAYESCGGWGECCSRLCVIEPSGTGVCRFISGCLSEGELCDPTCVRTCAGCCSGECEVKTLGGLTTSRCTKGGSCLPPGHVCGGTGTSNCCDGGAVQCRMTRTGITRCYGAAYPGDCFADSSPCAFSDQCCTGYCLPDAVGDLFCEPGCRGLGEACTASADCCVDPVILKCEDCTCVESDRDCVDIGNPCETTGECCYGVCDDDGGTDFFCVLN